MTLTFTNGGNPGPGLPYPGFSFANQLELLTEIQTRLLAAGWLTVAGSPSSLPMRMRGTLGSDFCYIQFNILNGNSLLIRGSDDAVGTNLSSNDAVFSMPFSPDVSGNRLYIAADAHAGAITILPVSGLSEVMFFGFCDRFNSLDNTCVYVGRAFTSAESTEAYNTALNLEDGYSLAQVLKRIADPVTFWPSQVAGYTIQASPTSSYSQYDLTTVMDSAVSNISASASWSATTNLNTSYRAPFGAVERQSGLPLLNNYYFKEGLANSSSYGNTASLSAGIPLYVRGTIPFIKTGFASLDAGTQWDSVSGETYITGSLRHQGMRIA